MLLIWLIPVLVVGGLLIAGLYLLVRLKGGSGVRTQGRTIVDVPQEEDSSPPD